MWEDVKHAKSSGSTTFWDSDVPKGGSSSKAYDDTYQTKEHKASSQQFDFNSYGEGSKNN